MRSDYITNDFLKVFLFALTRADRLICEISLQTGWRIDDVLELKTEQIQHALQLKKPYLQIIEKKTQKKSKKYLPRNLLDECLTQAGEFYLFAGRDDYRKHRTRQAVYLDIKRAAKKFNIKYNISPHSMRKNYSVYIYNKYGLERTKNELNHDNELVTLLYALSDEISEKHAKNKNKHKKKAG